MTLYKEVNSNKKLRVSIVQIISFTKILILSVKFDFSYFLKILSCGNSYFLLEIIQLMNEKEVVQRSGTVRLEYFRQINYP
jgi:hypothetical protein